MIINTSEKLVKLCNKLNTAKFITVDTEFIREKTYYPYLCLIQVGAFGKAWLIDPLSELDLFPFFQILLNKNIIKVFHACRQDLEIFYSLMKVMPTPIFDTQIGAMVCGYDYNVSYQILVKDYLNIKLDKCMRITDWSRRPLSLEQENYAKHDVLELQQVYQKMMERICLENRLDWIQEEMLKLSDKDNYDINPTKLFEKMRVPFHDKEKTHACVRLCEWREKLAQKNNIPRKFLLSDDAIIELSIEMPKTYQDLESLRSISKGFGSSVIGKSLLQEIELISKESPKNWTISKKIVLNPAQKNLLEVSKLLLNISCEKERVAPSLVANNDDLSLYITGQQEVSFMSGWRYQVFGKSLEALKKGELIFLYDLEEQRIKFIPTKFFR